jgi:hypothetical protein
MAYFFTRFEVPDNAKFDEEVKELYRIRDNTDKKVMNNRGLQVNLNYLGQHPDSNGSQSITSYFNRKPNDRVWHSMSEGERIENGLPTKYLYYATSAWGYIAYMGFFGN